jgi:hypothetical protein
VSRCRASARRVALALLFALCLGGCAGTPELNRPPGIQGCESFFIYVLCVSDLDENGQVDYMYFDDSRDIFMYEETMLAQLEGVLPFHDCAIPMSKSTRDYSSQLLYDEALGLAERLRLKGKLIMNYRAAQPAVDACHSASHNNSDYSDDPFPIDEEWDEGAP